MQHSTLEVDSNRWLEQDGTAAPIVAQGPQNEKVIGYNDGKIVDHNDVGKQVVAVEAYDLQSEPSPPEEEHKLMGLRRKTFFSLLPVVLVLVIAGIVGGSVGGAMAVRNKEKPATVPTNMSVPTSQARYANTGLAAIQWTDFNRTLHKRLYYQDNSDKIRESAWDNSTAFDSAWRINAISDAVKPGTPIAAAADIPMPAVIIHWCVSSMAHFPVRFVE